MTVASPPPVTPLLALAPFCSDTSETVALRCAEGRVSRRGDSLVFTTSRTSRVNNLADGEAFQSFRYYGRLRTSGPAALHVIDVQGYESGVVELISDITGEWLIVPGYPVISPERTRFAAAAASYETCEGTVQLDVWRVTDGLPVREFTIAPFDCTWDTGWWPGELVWRSPDTLSFPRISLPADTTRRQRRQLDTAPAILVRRAGAWSLDSVSMARLPPRQPANTF
jgi:hypothetical protein